MSVGVAQAKATITPIPGELWLMRDACRRSLRSATSSPGSPQAMIPGLPDDVAYQCLLRVPLEAHHRLAQVCRRWREAARTQALRFYEDRRGGALADRWIVALVRDEHNRNSLRAFDVRRRSWLRLPAMPDTRHGRAVGQECRVVGGKVVVCGGWRDRTLDEVTVYDPRRNAWLPGPRMLSPRAHFVSGVIGSRLYVAGGGNGRQPRSQSAEYYDAEDGAWHALPPLEVCISFCLGVVAAGGRWFVQARGGVPRETQVFLPDLGLWSAFRSNMLAWPHRPHATVGDRLYRADVSGGRHELMRYDPDADAWTGLGAVAGGPRRRIHELLGVGPELWAVAEDLSVGALEVGPGGTRFVEYCGAPGGDAGKAERVISCHALVL